MIVRLLTTLFVAYMMLSSGVASAQDIYHWKVHNKTTKKVRVIVCSYYGVENYDLNPNQSDTVPLRAGKKWMMTCDFETKKPIWAFPFEVAADNKHLHCMMGWKPNQGWKPDAGNGNNCQPPETDFCKGVGTEEECVP